MKFKLGDKVRTNIPDERLVDIGFRQELANKMLTIKKIAGSKIYVKEDKNSYFIEKELFFPTWKKRFEK